jgi:hypothetical protein
MWLGRDGPGRVTRVPSLTGFDVDPVGVIRTGDHVVVDADAGTVSVWPTAGR